LSVIVIGVHGANSSVSTGGKAPDRPGRSFLVNMNASAADDETLAVVFIATPSILAGPTGRPVALLGSVAIVGLAQAIAVDRLTALFAGETLRLVVCRLVCKSVCFGKAGGWSW
jgi:hypothetical protein